MDKIDLKNDLFEYRIVNFQAQIGIYNEFLKNLRLRKNIGLSCEYEIKGEQLEDFSIKYGLDPKSVIIMFFPYMTEDKLKYIKENNLSVHAFSIDYHIIVKRLTEGIVEKIKLAYPDANFHIQCDNGEYNEKFFAINSGLGKEGLNSLVINEVYGSYGFISLIFTDIELEEYITQKKKCIMCRKCITCCPSKVISEKGVDFSKCISFLTQKKELSLEEEKLLKIQNKGYGCDACQNVCPENKNKKYSNIEDFNIDLLYNIDLDNVLNISNKEFKNIYGKRNFAWKGKNIIKRNILILENNE